MALKEGDVAPPFTVKTNTGATVNLSDFKGKQVLLWFYPKADTPGCTAEGKGFQEKSGDYAKRNVQILGVSFDSVEANQKFAEKYGFKYPLLSDTERKIGIAYGATAPGETGGAKRIAYLIDENGKIAKSFGAVSAKEFPELGLAYCGN